MQNISVFSLEKKIYNGIVMIAEIILWNCCWDGVSDIF